MNFLFISKLLPLFVYPLGLTCLLLLVSLWFQWRSPRKASNPIAIALLILLLSSNSVVSNYLIRSLEWQNLPSEDMSNAEAIVVLGGATKSAIPPRLMVDLNEEGDRLLRAAQLYRQEKAPLIIVAGGRMSWSNSGASEAADMGELLQFMGVPASAIIQEPNSLNTRQNAVNVQQILVEKGIERIILVTSAIHMPRSLLVFKRLGITAIPAPTDYLVSQADFTTISSDRQAIALALLPDVNNLAKTTKALKEYIGIGIYRLRGWL